MFGYQTSIFVFFDVNRIEFPEKKFHGFVNFCHVGVMFVTFACFLASNKWMFGRSRELHLYKGGSGASLPQSRLSYKPVDFAWSTQVLVYAVDL